MALVVAGGYYLWLGLSTRAALVAVRADAAELRSRLSAQDVPGLERALGKLEHDAGTAHRRTGSLGWRIAEHAPFLGDDARAAAILAAAGDDIARNAGADLARSVGQGILQRLTPHRGRIDLAAVQAITPTLSRIGTVLDRADDQVRTIDASALIGAIRGPVGDAIAQIDQARQAADSAERAARVLPAMLGATGPKTYLLMFDNNAEVRATGGMPGAYALVRADRGSIAIVRQGAAADLHELAEPALPLTKAETAIYGPQLGTYFQDANFTPDFPRTAALVRANLERHLHLKVDGVLSVDTVTLGYLLETTGPLTVDGVRLTGANAAAELLSDVYRRLPKARAQDAFFGAVARAVFERVSAGGASPAALARALGRSVEEGRSYVHSFDPSVQAVLAPTQVAGALTEPGGEHPQVGVYLNDATGSKMSYYLRSSADLSAVGCAGGVQHLAARATLQMLRPAARSLPVSVTGTGQYGTPEGEQLVLVRIYGPVGGELQNVQLDGGAITSDVVVDQGRPVATLAVELSAGQQVGLSWVVLSGPGQTGPTELSQSPGMTSRPARLRVASIC